MVKRCAMHARYLVSQPQSEKNFCRQQLATESDATAAAVDDSQHIQVSVAFELNPHLHAIVSSMGICHRRRAIEMKAKSWLNSAQT